MTLFSGNGYVASPYPADIGIVPMTVAGVTFQVAGGDVLTVLQYVVEQVNARVEPLVSGGGYSFRANVNDPSSLSNHASGTAIDYNPEQHPNATTTTSTWTQTQIAEIELILAETSGAVRWGGDYNNTPDSMHFEINVGVVQLAAAARALGTTGGGGVATPGFPAGEIATAYDSATGPTAVLNAYSELTNLPHYSPDNKVAKWTLTPSQDGWLGFAVWTADGNTAVQIFTVDGVVRSSGTDKGARLYRVTAGTPVVISAYNTSGSPVDVRLQVSSYAQLGGVVQAPHVATKTAGPRVGLDGQFITTPYDYHWGEILGGPYGDNMAPSYNYTGAQLSNGYLAEPPASVMNQLRSATEKVPPVKYYPAANSGGGGQRFGPGFSYDPPYGEMPVGYPMPAEPPMNVPRGGAGGKGFEVVSLQWLWHMYGYSGAYGANYWWWSKSGVMDPDPDAFTYPWISFTHVSYARAELAVADLLNGPSTQTVGPFTEQPPFASTEVVASGSANILRCWVGVHVEDHAHTLDSTSWDSGAPPADSGVVFNDEHGAVRCFAGVGNYPFAPSTDGGLTTFGATSFADFGAELGVVDCSTSGAQWFEVPADVLADVRQDPYDGHSPYDPMRTLRVQVMSRTDRTDNAYQTFKGTGLAVKLEMQYPEYRAVVLPAAPPAPPTGGGGGTPPPPVAAFTWTPDVTGWIYTFDASASTGDIVTYEWDWADPLTATFTQPLEGVTVDHFYRVAPETYTVTLTVTDYTGATSSVSHDVSVEGGRIIGDYLGSGRAFAD